jgi:Domain of unknown function (DUF6430)
MFPSHISLGKVSNRFGATEMWKFFKANSLALLKSFFGASGVIFLPIESYEVVSDQNIVFPFGAFLGSAAVLGSVFYFLDGYFLSGFLKKRVAIKNHGFDTKIFIEFGDLFSKQGWKAIATSDFFDSHVDEDLVSSKSLHGHSIKTFWPNNRDDWQKQINSSLKGLDSKKEIRSKGNAKRYQIGTTAVATTTDQKFLFVALGKADIFNNVTTASAESLVCAVRGMLKKARAVCSYEPLSIPLMGSGLARVGIKSSVLVDLILAAIHEESKLGKITGVISIVLPPEKENEINLKNYERSWNDYGK